MIYLWVCSAYPYALFTAMSHISATNNKMKEFCFLLEMCQVITLLIMIRAAFYLVMQVAAQALEFSPDSKETYFRFKTMGDGFDCIIEPIVG